jgi:hypothetical protein
MQILINYKIEKLYSKWANLGYVPSFFSDWKDIGETPHVASLGFRSQ